MPSFSARLEQFGLGNFAELFAEHGIDIDVLPDLIEADLEKKYPRGHSLLLKAEACLTAGRSDAAQAATEALTFARAHGYRAFEATALRLVAAATPASKDAGRTLSEGREIAEALGLIPELDAIGRLEAEKEMLSPTAAKQKTASLG